jgi:hypothetical protein
MKNVYSSNPAIDASSDPSFRSWLRLSGIKTPFLMPNEKKNAPSHLKTAPERRTDVTLFLSTKRK